MQILAEAEDLPKTANIQTQLIGLWSALVFGVVLLIAFLAFPGFFPPMSPDMTAEQVAQFYRDDTAMIRFSMITFNLCGVMLLPLFMVIVVQMKRMATQSHVFAYCYLTAAISGATLYALADIFYLVAAFRPDRSPELVLLLNDMAWMIFIAPGGRGRPPHQKFRVGKNKRNRAKPSSPRTYFSGWQSTSTPGPIRCSSGGSGITPSRPHWRWPLPPVPPCSPSGRWPGTGKCPSGCATGHSPCSWS